MFLSTPVPKVSCFTLASTLASTSLDRLRPMLKSDPSGDDGT